MSKTLIFIATIPLALSMAVVAQPTAQANSATAPMSTREARQAAKTENPAAQAAYFHQREAQFRAKAIDEKAELDRRAQVNAGL